MSDLHPAKQLYEENAYTYSDCVSASKLNTHWD